MPEPTPFEHRGEFSEFRPSGEVSLHAGVQLVAQALADARAQGVRKLLIVITDLTGYGVPTLVQRYKFANAWATAAGGEVILAIVAPAKVIDPEKLAVDIAFNRGLLANVFTGEEEAIAWLTDQQNPF